MELPARCGRGTHRRVVVGGTRQLSYGTTDRQCQSTLVIDRFTHFTLDFLERVDARSNATLAQLFASYNRATLQSTATPRTDLFGRPLTDVKITDFLGAAPRVELTPGAYPGFTGLGDDIAGAVGLLPES